MLRKSATKVKNQAFSMICSSKSKQIQVENVCALVQGVSVGPIQFWSPSQRQYIMKNALPRTFT